METAVFIIKLRGCKMRYFLQWFKAMVTDAFIIKLRSIRFCGRLDQNSGSHGNTNIPLSYNEENDISTVSLLFLIRSFSNLQLTRTGIKSRTSSNFVQIGPLPSEIGALERLKTFPLT